MIQLTMSAQEEFESALDQAAQTLTDLLWELEYDEIEAILEIDLAPLCTGNSLSESRVQVYLFGLLKEGKVAEVRRIAKEIDECREAHEEEEDEEDAADDTAEDKSE